MISVVKIAQYRWLSLCVAGIAKSRFDSLSVAGAVSELLRLANDQYRWNSLSVVATR